MAKEKTSTARRRATTASTTNPTSILQIDEHRLEKEWGDQALLFYEYAEQLANARLAMDTSKAELEVTTAELDTAIRKDPDSYGVNKLTETAVKTTIVQQQTHQTAVEQYNQACHAVRMLDAMVSAIEHRRTALKSMVELLLANYYAEPTLNRSQQNAYDEMSKTEVRSRGKVKRPTN